MQLVVQAGAQCGQVYKIEKDSLTIGRGTSNDITFVDPAMSRVHCEIRREGDDYVVEDRHSANGTFVNDEQIELPFILRPGDTIRLGQTVLLFQEEGVGETVAASQAAGAVETEPAGKPWVLIGGLIGIAFLVLVVAFAMSNRTPGPNVVVVNTTAPPTVSQTRASEPSPEPTAIPSATSSLLPTATSEATVPAAETTAVTATPASEETRPYPIPVLSVVLPAPQTKFSANSAVPFNWIAVDVLRPNEIYRVQVSTNNDFNTVACEIRTRETYVTIPGEGVTCNTQWQFGQHYYWRVHIIPRDAPFSEPVASANMAPINEFTWGP